MVYYLDVIFLVNGVLNYLALWFAGLLQKRPAKGWRLFLGAASGAGGYCLLLFLPPPSALVQVVLGIGLLLLALLIGYGPHSPGELARLFGMALLALFLLAGALLFLLSAWPQVENQWRKTGVVSLLPLLAASAAVFGLLTLARQPLLLLSSRRTEGCLMRFWLGQHSTDTVGLLDTGNFLQKDALGHPVVIVSFSAVHPLLSLESRLLFLDHAPPEQVISQWKKEGRLGELLPYSSLGQEKGVLPALQMDRIEFITTGKIVQKPVTAIHQGSLGGWGAVLHPSVLENAR